MTAEHGSAAFILARLSDRMPAFVRSFVERIITQARSDAQGMRQNRPAPPVGGPGGAPTAGPGMAPAGPGMAPAGPGSVPTPPAGPFGG